MDLDLMATLGQLNPAAALAWLCVLALLSFFVAAFLFVQIKVLPLRLQNLRLRAGILRKRLILWRCYGEMARTLKVSRQEAKQICARLTPEVIAQFQSEVEAMQVKKAEETLRSLV